MKNNIATEQCYHTCPQSDGSKPHEGGSVLKGSSNVFAEGKMVARKGDPLQCKSPNPDFIQGGSTSVYANGMAVGRMGDMTVHGGKIIEGATKVFIG